MFSPESTSVTNRRAWGVNEVAARLGVSRNFVLGQIAHGFLRAKRLGGRVVVLSEDVDAYLEAAEEVRRKAPIRPGRSDSGAAVTV
jgi:excisionase family DNA binding protein